MCPVPSWCRGVGVLGVGLAAMRRNRMAGFKHIVAERISLVAPQANGGLRPAAPLLLADLASTRGGPELKMHGGRILLTTPAPERAAVMQIDTAFQPVRIAPLPPAAQPSLLPTEAGGTPSGASSTGASRTGSSSIGSSGSSRGALGPGQAWALDRHGLDAALQPHRGGPGIMLYSFDQRPEVLLSPSAGLVRFGAVEPAGTTAAAHADSAGAARTQPHSTASAAPRASPAPAPAAEAAPAVRISGKRPDAFR